MPVSGAGITPSPRQKAQRASAEQRSNKVHGFSTSRRVGFALCSVSLRRELSSGSAEKPANDGLFSESKMVRPALGESMSR